MSNPKVKEAIDWYSKNKVIYQALARKVESILREILDSLGINYYSVSSRPKSIESYKRKALRYRDPRSEILDMAGIRVITYTNSDARKTYKAIKNAFEIVPEHEIDKTEELGIDRVGYRSIHCIGKLGKKRLALPENRLFKDFCFEIQVRTILQHAWAEFEHDRNYKFSGVLPRVLRRRLALLAGSLEIVDREFDDISEAIDVYAGDIARKAEAGDFNVPIDSTSLTEYMKRKFAILVEKGVQPKLLKDEQIIKQMRDMGIDIVRKLDAIVPDDYIKTKERYGPALWEENFRSMLIDLLIIHDAQTYFEKAWKRSWDAITESDTKLYKYYGIDFSEYANRYNIDIFPDLTSAE